MLEPWDKPGWKPVIGSNGKGEWLSRKTCPECKTKIPSRAVRCPSCGGKIGLIYSLQSIGVLLVVFGILGLIGLCLLLLFVF